jgi:hypothetical protein
MSLYGRKKNFTQQTSYIRKRTALFNGIDEVMQKEVQFLQHLKSPLVTQVSEPLVAGNYFTVRMQMQCEHNQREKLDLDELLVYKVAAGKIAALICYIG